ncbi:MAG: hypothetical protein ACQCN6_00580 [Candidatus Bathyarchaeia archaeon]|jgi:hypothetical protein
MIQIEDWMIIAGLLFVFILIIAYLLYFKVSRKLFPEMVKFGKEIEPEKGTVVCEVKGSGIVKTVELETSRNCLIDITVDGTSHTLLNIGRESEQQHKPCQDILTVKEQLNQRFTDNFAIHILNQSNHILEYSGLANYEVKKQLAVTVKTVFSELTKSG